MNEDHDRNKEEATDELNIGITDDDCAVDDESACRVVDDNTYIDDAGVELDEEVAVALVWAMDLIENVERPIIEVDGLKVAELAGLVLDSLEVDEEALAVLYGNFDVLEERTLDFDKRKDDEIVLHRPKPSWQPDSQ